MVVLGHYGIFPANIYSPYTFHMPLFFFLGGMLYRDKDFISVIKSVISKHLLYVVYTFLITSLIASALGATFGIWTRDLYSGNVVTTTFESNFHNNGYFLVAWFLFAYAIVSVVCRLFLYIKSSLFLFILAIIIGYYGMTEISQCYKASRIQSFNLLTQVMVGSMFYMLGFLLKNWILSLRSIYIPSVALFILFTMDNFGILGGLMMSWSKYPHGFLSHFTSIMLCIVTIFTMTNVFTSTEGRMGFLLKIGSESKVIMSYHLLSFTIIDIVFYKLGLYDITKSSSLSHYSTQYFWFIYLALGILIPMGISSFYSKVMERSRMMVKSSIIA